MKRDQYYIIYLDSSFYYDETEKIIVKSFRELKDYVKSKIDYLLQYHPISKDQKQKYNIKKLYKRIHMYYIQDGSGDWDRHKDQKLDGYSFFIDYRDKKGDFDYLLMYDCRKILKKDLWEYSGFKEIKN